MDRMTSHEANVGERAVSYDEFLEQLTDLTSRHNVAKAGGLDTMEERGRTARNLREFLAANTVHVQQLARELPR